MEFITAARAWTGTKIQHKGHTYTFRERCPRGKLHKIIKKGDFLEGVGDFCGTTAETEVVVFDGRRKANKDGILKPVFLVSTIDSSFAQAVSGLSQRDPDTLVPPAAPGRRIVPGCTYN